MNITVKLDRITISGAIIKKQTALTELKNALLKTSWEQVNDHEFALKRLNENGVYEHVAGLYANQHQQSTWRLDTSNHLMPGELESVVIPIKMMSGAHLTRIDVAFDIINGTAKNMSHRIYRFGAGSRTYLTDTQEITGRSRTIQTIYSGSRKSEQQIRYYDKLAEQKTRRKDIPEGVEQWERLELQLRGKSTGNWKTACKKMLMEFKLPEYMSVKNPIERAMLMALESHTVEWDELAKGTRSKYRQLLKSDIGLNDDYSQKMWEVFNECSDDIQQEIDNFMGKILG